MLSGSEVAAAHTEMWVIEPRRHGAFSRLRELWSYRYLWWYFASETIVSLYRGSMLGWLWLLLRVVAPVGLNALVFGGIFDLQTKVQHVPYFLFFLSGTITWTLFERSLVYVTRSLERNRKLVTRVYFPRLILPMSAIAPGLMYLVILLIVLAITVVGFHQRTGVWYVLFTPRLFVSAGAVVASLMLVIGVGLWTSVLQARYRDVRYALRYVTPFWFLLTPVVYPMSVIHDKYPWLVAINPMAPIVEAFRWGTIGGDQFQVVPAAISFGILVVTMVTGLWYFNREEAASVDKL
ncbi:MAG TPA: ABC transporter permease [Vicinamibacterales bacterium]|jgi:lipopolysaccharide transport system permease protein|nr:ABC transporter permease [Vicinamibacterales bacterium]HVH56168.1 ABC transporter permease [Vicinamibacterales bacterium]